MTASAGKAPAPLPVVLVGAGHRAQSVYGPLLTGPIADRIRVVAVVGRGESRAAALAQTLDVPYSLDLGEVSSRWGARGAICAVSSPENHRVAAALVNEGLPALLETPLALNLADARKLEADISRSGLPIEVAEQNPRTVEVKLWRRLIEDGFLGRVALVSSDGAGYRYHATAVARALMERSEATWAVGMRSLSRVDLGRNTDAEAIYVGSVQLQGGALFQLRDAEGIHTSQAPWLRSGWVLQGDGGSLRTPDAVRRWEDGQSDDYRLEWVRQRVGGVDVTQAVRFHGDTLVEAVSPFPHAPLNDDQQAAAQCLLDWLDRIEGKSTETGWSVADGLQDLEWIEAIERSALLGGVRMRVGTPSIQG